MTTQDNAISTIVDGAVNAFILEISANYLELANVMGVVASAATVYGFAKIRSLFIELASKVEGIGRLNKDMFVVQAVGQSMEPRIHNGDYCIFEKYSGGSRQGKIVLAQHRGYFDEDNAGAYSIKEYSSEKSYNVDGSWQHESITLRPFNPAFEPIRIDTEDAESFAIIGEFVGVVTL